MLYMTAISSTSQLSLLCQIVWGGLCVCEEMSVRQNLSCSKKASKR